MTESLFGRAIKAGLDAPSFDGYEPMMIGAGVSFALDAVEAEARRRAAHWREIDHVSGRWTVLADFADWIQQQKPAIAKAEGSQS